MPKRSGSHFSHILLGLTMIALAFFGARMATADPDLTTPVIDPVPPGIPSFGDLNVQAYLPVIINQTYWIKPPLPPPIAYSSPYRLNADDFNQIRSTFKARGTDLAFNKIGFHVAGGGNRTGISDWMAALDAAGVPFFYKSVNDGGAIYEAQQFAKASGVPHTLVYRRGGGGGDLYWDVPDYEKTPKAAALEHWLKHIAVFPPELDPAYVWLETINEVDKTKSEWLGEFALETAKLAVAQGYKWAAFGWSTGEPEPYHWETPSMLAFLRYAADHPNQIAIALHEYSLDAGDIGNIYPWLVGRFQKLFEICDKYGIKRPTVLITEWGWTYDQVPGPDVAMEQIAWAAKLYAAYPEVKGAAIWYLGPGFGSIAEKAVKLIVPSTDFSLKNYFEYKPGIGQIDPSLFNPPAWTFSDPLLRPRPGIHQSLIAPALPAQN